MRSQLAARVRGEGAPLGEIFSFISGLYFRGKLAYARAFAAPPRSLPGVLVITASGGLVSPDKIFNLKQLRGISAAAIDPDEPAYRVPLLRDAQRICDRISDACAVVLLGSIATPKYVEPLLSVFGERLLFPAEFVGRGDMSRGGLMLRSEREGTQLSYVPVLAAVRHGPHPPRLPKLPGSLVRPGLSMRAADRRAMEAVIFVGIQGSGKTSFYRERFSGTHVRISLDMLRTRHREQLLFHACLAAKQPFVIDNTNPLPSDRARYLGEAHQAGFRVVAYYFETSLRDAIGRNNQRAGKEKFPPVVLAGTLKKLEPPALEEGFDRIYVVTISPEGEFLLKHATAPDRSGT
jgi:predicted kinase